MSQTLLAPLYGGLQPPTPTPRRNIFISYFGADIDEVNSFIYRWGTTEKVFTPKALGTFHNADFINSTNPEYVMGEIRRRYLQDSTVTILLVGKCTHSRRYVDWELKSSLRQGLSTTPNGLLAYVLPSAMPPATNVFGEIPWTLRAWPHIPERLAANWSYSNQDRCYARYFVMPTSAVELRQQIENSFWDRTNRAELIQNSASMFTNNSLCRSCGITHPAG